MKRIKLALLTLAALAILSLSLSAPLRLTYAQKTVTAAALVPR